VKDSNESEPQGLVTAAVVAKHLSVTPQTVLNWERSGLIPSVIRIGRVIRFRLEDVNAALAANRASGQNGDFTSEAISSAADESDPAEP